MNPALQDPGLIAGLDAFELSDELTRKNLTCLASVLQHLSNDQPVKSMPALDAWLRRASQQLDSLFRRIAQDPSVPLGIPSSELVWQFRGIGRVAVKALSHEDSAFVFECFQSSRADLQSRVQSDPEVFAMDAFFQLLDEMHSDGREHKEPQKLPPQWLLLMNELPESAGNKKKFKTLFKRAAPWRRVHVRFGADGRSIEFYASEEADALPMPKRVALGLLRGCYAREDADLLELETTEESFVLGFKECKNQLQLWCSTLNEWIAFLHTPTAVARKQSKVNGLKG